MIRMNTWMKLLGFAFVLLGFTPAVQATLTGILPATTGGSDYQAWYDDELDITWAANANINGSAAWDDQVAWVTGLDIGGVTGWRLASMDVNGDGNILDCRTTTRLDCMDNEYGYLYYYGAGTVFGAGITSVNPGPFSNVQPGVYWSGTGLAGTPSAAWVFVFSNGSQGALAKKVGYSAWAVHAGNVGAVPGPGTLWIFAAGFLVLLMMGASRRSYFL